MSDLLQAAFIASLLAGMIRIATPIIFAAMGELVTERAGVLNLGVEGMMLTGALVGFLVTFSTGSLWLGTIVAILAGGMLGLLMAFMSSTLKVDQILTGLAINLLAAGITTYGYRLTFTDVGTENPATISTFETIRIPGLSEIPLLGQVLFSQPLLTYIALLLVPAISIFLYRTKYGLELRGLGDNPRAVDMKGVNITGRQYLAVMFGGMMACLGGAFLTQVAAGIFVPQISAGRGWIALAIVIFGNWRPSLILLGALFFGFIDSFQLSLQAVGVDLPYQLLLALPYLLTIAALVINRGRSQAPLSLGIPYHRESRG
jgi:simple sugar transport system permease protein